MADVTLCPSFRTIIVAGDPTVDQPPTDDSDPSVDFEFAAAPPPSPCTIHPVFGRERRPWADEEEEEEEEEEEPAEGSYCRCRTPPPKSPEPMRKSWSTGSTRGRRSLSACGWGLVFGRSRSVGKERLGEFLPSSPSKKKEGREETEVAAAYRRFYGGRSERRRRSSFSAEAYRKESVGFLPSLNSLGRRFRGF